VDLVKVNYIKLSHYVSSYILRFDWPIRQLSFARRIAICTSANQRKITPNMLHLIVRCSAELLGIAVDCFAIADDNFRHYRHCEH